MAMAQNRTWGTNGLGKTAVNYNVGRATMELSGLQAGSTFKAFVLAAATASAHGSVPRQSHHQR
jgi:hypothetical protein